MEETYKEVYFHEYCEKCKHKDKEDFRDPCNECLGNGFNVNSHKPTYFEEKEKEK